MPRGNGTSSMSVITQLQTWRRAPRQLPLRSESMMSNYTSRLEAFPALRRRRLQRGAPSSSSRRRSRSESRRSTSSSSFSERRRTRSTSWFCHVCRSASRLCSGRPVASPTASSCSGASLGNSTQPDPTTPSILPMRLEAWEGWGRARTLSRQCALLSS